MLKAAGAILVIFSCSAFGYSKSLVLSGRLRQLREIEKMVFLILGEITYNICAINTLHTGAVILEK